MPYLLVRDTDSGSVVDGLPVQEIRAISLKTSSKTDIIDEKNRRVEFDTDCQNIINALETIGYSIVTSAHFGPSEFIWTLFKQ